MRIRTLFLSLLLLSGGLTFAQTDSLIFGVNYANSALRFGKMDITTGDLTIINNTPTSMDQFGSGVCDIDPHFAGRYFYVRAGRIYTVDMQTGTVLHNPTVTCSTHTVAYPLPITNIEFNWLDGQIYGLRHVGSELWLAKVDPISGEMTVISPTVMSPDLYQSGVSDLDPLGRRYFYVRGGRICTASLDTGTLLHNPTMSSPLPAVIDITNISYNWITDQLVGLHYESTGGVGNLRFAQVDPVTGQVTILSQQPTSPAMYADGVNDINPALNVYSYLAFNGGTAEIITVDISTGGIVWKRTMQNPNNATVPLYNFGFKKQVDAQPSPNARYSYTPSGQTVSFRNISEFGRDFFWDFGDGNTHTDAHPTHTYAQPGWYTITMTAQNDFGADTLVQSIYVGGPATGVADEMGTALTLYPQPAQQMLSLRGWSGSESVEVQWRDLQGRVLASQTATANGGGMDLAVPAGLASGSYFLYLSGGTDTRVQRVAVQR